MEGKTKTADLSVRGAFALIEGALLAISYPFFYFTLPEAVKTSPALFLFVILPLLSFVISLAMNWFLQFMYCGSVSVSKITTSAAISPITTLSLTTLAYWLPFLRGPIGQLIPESPTESPEETSFVKDIWGFAFYLFWGGVYGQTIGSGMISACPK